jgi:RNA polymerase sigma-70 factor (ECF subfamily)
MSSIAIRYASSHEDAVQKINGGFLKVLQNLKSYNKKSALATWMRNVLVNHIIDEYRKEKKYIASIDLAEYYEEDALVEYNIGERNLEVKELLSMLDILSEVSKKVFNLYAIDGYKHKEISHMLGISEGTSKWHVSDARKKLKARLAEYGIEKAELMTTKR